MHFSPTDDQVALSGAVADLLARECTPEAVRAAWDTTDGRVPGLWDHLVEMGVIGTCATEEHGGMGLSMLDLAGVLVEVGRAAAPEPVVDAAAVAVPVLESAGGSIADEWVPALVGGEASVAVGVSAAIPTAGGSPPVENAATADVLLLSDGDVVHLVGAEAVTASPRTSVDGSRRVADVTWDPTPSTRIGGGETLQSARNLGVTATAAVLVGLGAAMLERTVEYAKERHQFGRPIGSFQAVKHHLATAALHLEYARPLVQRAAYTLTRTSPDPGSGTDPDPEGGAAVDSARDASMALAYAAEASHIAGRTALQVHGAIGYTVEYDLHLWLKRAWALESVWGSAAFHREEVARRVLDGPTDAPDWTDREHA